jgi:two-component system, NarL family, response regulator LiaR
MRSLLQLPYSLVVTCTDAASSGHSVLRRSTITCRSQVGYVEAGARIFCGPEAPYNTVANGLIATERAPWEAEVTMTNMIGLVLADDHRVFAEGLGVMLDAQDDLAVLGVAHDAHQAVELAAKHEPMVLLLDAHMPGSDLASTLRAVKAASPRSKVLMLSADTRKETITEALRAGADGFLAKDASSRQVASAIRSVVEGRTGMVVTAEPVARPSRDPSVDLRVRTLSVREREILGLLANGWSNRRIAEECFLSLNTVRTHVQNVLVKLGVHSKLEAVAFALEHQVVGNGNSASWVTGRA